MEKKIAAVYLRVAHADDMAMELQSDFVMMFAKSKCYTIGDCYCDNGESGIMLDRPEMNRLLTNIRAGKVETVIAKDITRIARDFRLTTKFLDEMRKYDVTVITVSDGDVKTIHDNFLSNLLHKKKRVLV